MTRPVIVEVPIWASAHSEAAKYTTSDRITPLIAKHEYHNAASCATKIRRYIRLLIFQEILYLGRLGIAKPPLRRADDPRDLVCPANPDNRAGHGRVAQNPCDRGFTRGASMRRCNPLQYFG